jgi:hypothetical protein
LLGGARSAWRADIADIEVNIGVLHARPCSLPPPLPLQPVTRWHSAALAGCHNGCKGISQHSRRHARVRGTRRSATLDGVGKRSGMATYGYMHNVVPWGAVSAQGRPSLAESSCHQRRR